MNRASDEARSGPAGPGLRIALTTMPVAREGVARRSLLLQAHCREPLVARSLLQQPAATRMGVAPRVADRLRREARDLTRAAQSAALFLRLARGLPMRSLPSRRSSTDCQWVFCSSTTKLERQRGLE